MWRKLGPLTMVLSLGLNVAFVTAWAVRTVGGPENGTVAPEHEVWSPLYRSLGVTPDQWRQIEPDLVAFQNESAAIRAGLHELRTEMIRLVAAEAPDRQAIQAKQDEIRAGQRRMQDLVVAHLLKRRELLTPEQADQLFEQMRERMEEVGPGRMLGLPEGSAP